MQRSQYARAPCWESVQFLLVIIVVYLYPKGGQSLRLPLAVGEVDTSETVEHIPPGELAVHHGTKVAARDGRLGHVAELVLDLDTGHISHFVLEEGHLWGKKEVTVPVTAIDYLLENTVYLKLDKKEVESLPAVPVKRHFGRQ